MKKLMFTLIPLILVSMIFGIDHLIIAPEEFIPLADELATFYSNNYGIDRTVVDQQEIFNQYGESPEGIRDYIQACFPNQATWLDNSVLLIGSGTNQWEMDIEKNRIMVFGTSDDNFVIFGDDTLPNIPIGRIPAQNIDQLEIYINKLIQYIEEPTLGRWRNKLLILADDEHKSGELEGIPANSGMNHTWKAQETGDAFNNSLYIEKVLGIEYDFDENGYKPEATEDLISKLNEGSLIWHYIGHGNYHLLGDEAYFDSSLHLPLLDNVEHPFLFTAASSSVAQFQDPNFDCLAEQLLFLDNGGAIASISATEPTIPTVNHDLFLDFFANIIEERMQLGPALIEAKSNSNSGYIYTKKLYNLLGDPLLFINPPLSENSITISGNPETLFVGDYAEISGIAGNGINSGIADLQIFEAKYNIHYENSDNGQFYEVDYTKNGNSIFENVSDLEDGLFSIDFTVPDNINFGDSGKIVSYIYCEEQNKDFVSYLYPLQFSELTQINNDEVILPNVISLTNYPNPFNPTTTVSFSIPSDSKVLISIFNTKGQKVKNLVDRNFDKGNHSVIWNGDDDNGNLVNSGVFFLKLSINNENKLVKKCLLLK